MKQLRRPFRAALGALLLACAGCPATLDDPERFSDAGVGDGAGCPDIPSTLFAKTCAKSGCHSAADTAQGLDLQSPDPASRLVGVTSTEGAGLLIDRSAPTMSILYTKLTKVPPFGSRMPLASMPLDEATIACVLAWISTTAALDDASLPDGGTESDTGVQLGALDSGGSGDAGAHGDAGASSDAGASVDAGLPSDAARGGDTGGQDAGVRDASIRDAGPKDTGSSG